MEKNWRHKLAQLRCQKQQAIEKLQNRLKACEQNRQKRESTATPATPATTTTQMTASQTTMRTTPPHHYHQPPHSQVINDRHPSSKFTQLTPSLSPVPFPNLSSLSPSSSSSDRARIIATMQKQHVEELNQQVFCFWFFFFWRACLLLPFLL